MTLDELRLFRHDLSIIEAYLSAVNDLPLHRKSAHYALDRCMATINI